MKKYLPILLSAILIFSTGFFAAFPANAADPVCFYYDDFSTNYEKGETVPKGLSHTYPAGYQNLSIYQDDTGNGILRVLPYTTTVASQFSKWIKAVPGKPKIGVHMRIKPFMDTHSSHVTYSPANGEPTLYFQRGSDNGVFDKLGGKKMLPFSVDDRKNWYDIVIVYDNASPIRTIYINGKDYGSFDGNNYAITGDFKFNLSATMSATSYLDVDFLKIFEVQEDFTLGKLEDYPFTPTKEEAPTNVISPLENPYQEPSNNVAPRHTVKDLGIAVTTAKTTYTTYGYDAKGDPEIYFGIQGATFYAINGNTGEVNFSQKLTGSALVKAQDVGPDGNCYFVGTNGRLQRYSPKDKQITEMPNFTPIAGEAYTLRVSEDLKVFVSTFDKAGGYVCEYDLKTQSFRNLGVMKEGAQYNQGMAVTDKYVYVGTGVEPHQSVVRYDRATGQREIFAQGMGGGAIYSVEVIDGKVFAMKWQNLLVYDEETKEQLYVISATGKQYVHSLPYPDNADWFFYQKGVDLYRHSLSTKENVKVATVPAPADRPLIGLDWVKRNGEWVLGLNSDFVGEFFFFNPKDNSLDKVSTEIKADSGPDIQSIELGEDGTIYVGGYQYGISAFDGKTNEKLFNLQNFHQAEGIGFLNGNVYWGTYTGAVVYKQDPDQPFDYLLDHQTTGNPKVVFDIDDQQDRPFVMQKGPENTLLIGTIPDYGVLGGVLAVYEEDAYGNVVRKDSYRNLIKDHSIAGIAYKDGKIYVGTTVSGGIGIEPVLTEGKIAVIDYATMKVEKEVTPEIKGLGKTTAIIGQISFGPDGLLWACSDKKATVFAIDPNTLEVVKSLSMSQSDMPATRRGNYIRWGTDGLMYTSCGYQLSVVDTVNMKYQVLAKSSTHVILDEDGNVYYPAKTNLMKIVINQEDRLKGTIARAKRVDTSKIAGDKLPYLLEVIKEAEGLTASSGDEALSLASQKLAKAIDFVQSEDLPITVTINGRKVAFDSGIGKPVKYENRRTVLPFRRLFELFGWTVGWEEATQKITATNQTGETMYMNVGANAYFINGKQIDFDLAPMLMNSRTYVPVRVIAEAMGYQVEWDELTQTVNIVTK